MIVIWGDINNIDLIRNRCFLAGVNIVLCLHSYSRSYSIRSYASADSGYYCASQHSPSHACCVFLLNSCSGFRLQQVNRSMQSLNMQTCRTEEEEQQLIFKVLPAGEHGELNVTRRHQHVVTRVSSVVIVQFWFYLQLSRNDSCSTKDS